MSESWLDDLAASFERAPDVFAYGLYRELLRDLVAEGMDPDAASRVALRGGQLALLLLLQYEQKEAAEQLRVGRRQAKTDTARVRRVVQRRALVGYWMSRDEGWSPPGLRVPDEQRVSLTAPPRRPRRRP